MQVVLAMFRSDGDRKTFSVHKETTVIGRREDCDLRIPLGEISRKHCKITRDGDTLRVEDLGSSNGTYVNGTRVQEGTVQAGDTVQVGSIAFVVQVDGVPADDELKPVLHTAPPNQDTATPANDPTEIREPEASLAADEGEFDPMSVLDSEDSGLNASGMQIDLEQSQHGDSSAET